MISEEKKKIVIENYFKSECNINTTIHDAYVKGFERGLSKALQPERKTGRWIDDGTELGCQCSECGKSLDEYINCGTEYMTLTEIPKFCPNCGADMREVEHDNN